MECGSSARSEMDTQCHRGRSRVRTNQTETIFPQVLGVWKNMQRETWEEAGLEVAALTQVVHGGHVDFSRPSREGGGVGFMRERIDWFSAQVPEGQVPHNQDGEVDEFALLPIPLLCERVAQGHFTREAGLVSGGFLGLCRVGSASLNRAC